MPWPAAVVEFLTTPSPSPAPSPQNGSLTGELLSGIIGAVLGALIAGVATFLVVKWQTEKLMEHEREQARLARKEERGRAREAQEEEHRNWLRRREESALTNLLTVLARLEQKGGWLWVLGRPPISDVLADKAEQTRALLDDLAYALRIDLPLVQNVEVRERFRALAELIDEYVRDSRELEKEDRGGRVRGDLIRYIQYVRYSIKRLLHDEPLPARAEPPILGRRDHALWTPSEVDPEDLYFMRVEGDGGISSE